MHEQPIQNDTISEEFYGSLSLSTSLVLWFRIPTHLTLVRLLGGETGSTFRASTNTMATGAGRIVLRYIFVSIELSKEKFCTASYVTYSSWCSCNGWKSRAMPGARRRGSNATVILSYLVASRRCRLEARRDAWNLLPEASEVAGSGRASVSRVVESASLSVMSALRREVHSVRLRMRAQVVCWMNGLYLLERVDSSQ